MTGMKSIVETVAASIRAESLTLDALVKHDPAWRNPKKGKVLHVYGTTRRPARDERAFMTSGSRRDDFEVVVEYVESSGSRKIDGSRDEEMELAAYEVADRLVEWADNHKILGAGDGAFDFDWVETRYVPDMAREFLVRYCQLRFSARKDALYGTDG